MRLTWLAAALALAAGAAGCDFAARTGIVRDDMRVLTDAQKAIADTKINHGDMTIQASGRLAPVPILRAGPADRSVCQHQRAMRMWRYPARFP